MSKLKNLRDVEMDPLEREGLVTTCLRYIEEVGLPRPYPLTVTEYEAWQKRRSEMPTISYQAQRKWLALYDLVVIDPISAWSLLLDVIARTTRHGRHIVALGPLTVFLRMHRHVFSSDIAAEARRNVAFREACEHLKSFERYKL